MTSLFRQFIHSLFRHTPKKKKAVRRVRLCLEELELRQTPATLSMANELSMPNGISIMPNVESLAITNTETPAYNQTLAVPGQRITYTITVSANGPRSVWLTPDFVVVGQPWPVFNPPPVVAFAGATVTDAFPTILTDVTYTSTASPGVTGNTSGSGDIHDTVTLLDNSIITYTVTATIDPAATGSFSDTATVTAPGTTSAMHAVSNVLVNEADPPISASQTSVTYGTRVMFSVTENAGGGAGTNTLKFYQGSTFLGFGTLQATVGNMETWQYITTPTQLNVGNGQDIHAVYDATDTSAGIVNNLPGGETVSPAPLTLTAITNTKAYDATTTAAAIPTVIGLVGDDTVTGLAETYTEANIGTGKTLKVSAYTVNDGNGGNNYSVLAVANTTGDIAISSAPTPLAPFGPVVSGLTVGPWFSWTAVAGAAHYELWINDVTANVSPSYDSGVIGTVFELGPNFSVDGHHYRWWVRAIDADGQPGPWSTAGDFTFSLHGTMPPSPPGSNLGTPNLIAPTGDVYLTPTGANGADATLPSFSWTAVTGADHYDFWINDLTANVSPSYARMSPALLPRLDRVSLATPTSTVGGCALWAPRAKTALGVPVSRTPIMRWRPPRPIRSPRLNPPISRPFLGTQWRPPRLTKFGSPIRTPNRSKRCLGSRTHR